MLSPISRRGFISVACAAAGYQPFASAAAGEEDLPFRQVHLDFHTSELIPEIGADFSVDEFGATLKRARVNSINVFAKDHHGYAYYQTTVATPHPNLKTDLLGGMVKACRANGIKVVYYYSLVWDVLESRKHAEWRVRKKDGSLVGLPPGTAWPWMCMNSPYLDHVVRENEDIVARYDVDGAWFDILLQQPEGCFCKFCVADRLKRNLSDSPDDIARQNKLIALRVEQKLNAAVHARFPRGLTFYNGRTVIGMRDELESFSHIEIESLPTGGWGYTHFQQRVRYTRTLGKQMIGMTGRFHKSWGDFGGLKNQAALDFECLNFVANGAKCCVGDQLHPRGVLDKATYDLIGNTYAKIEVLEPWVRSAAAVTDIGVLSSAPFASESTGKITPEDQGFTNMLVELHQQFDVLDLDGDWKKYSVIILPDIIGPHPKLLARLREFKGAVLLTHESLLNKAKGRFEWNRMPVLYKGPAHYAGEYFTWDGYDHFLYQSGLSVEAAPGAKVISCYAHPYFDRTPEHFSSHKQTPVGKRTNEPFCVLNDGVAYIANPVFRSYALDGYGATKSLVSKILGQLLPSPVIRTSQLPSTAQVTVMEQPKLRRTVVHLLHYPMTRRAPDMDIIEEPGILLDQEIHLKLAFAPNRVVLAPDGRPLTFNYINGYATCKVDKVIGHQAICFELGD